jgi:hypothetical protein
MTPFFQSGPYPREWVQELTNPQWQKALRNYHEADRYFYGDIFEEMSQDSGGLSPEPLYPLRINLVKMMVLLHAYTLFGQWEDRVIEWNSEDEKAIELIESVWGENDGDVKMAECAISCMLYGGAILKVVPDPEYVNRVRIEAIPPHFFFPRWHPGDINRLLEVTIAFQVTHAEARLAYGVDLGGNDHSTTLYMEKWSPRRYEVSVGGNVLERYSGVNPIDVIPFVYIPRLRSVGEFFGVSVANDLTGLQNELNLRLADIGDRINYNAHPIYYVANFTGKTKDLVVGQDEIWNLGMGINGMRPEAGVIEPRNEPSSSFQYIQFLLDLSRMSALVPPVAFGEDEGSQRSGLTLTLRMWPLVQQTKWTRIYWVNMLTKVNRYILRILRIFQEGVPEVDVKPRLAPILPRDRDQLIREITSLWNSRLPLITPEKALRRMGESGVEEEVNRLETLWQAVFQMSSSRNSSAIASDTPMQS